MASFAPNVRSLDYEHLEHDLNDLDRNDERERSTARDQRSRLSGSMTNDRKIAPSDRERNAERTHIKMRFSV